MPRRPKTPKEQEIIERRLKKAFVDTEKAIQRSRELIRASRARVAEARSRASRRRPD